MGNEPCLQELFSSIGREYGFDIVNAAYCYESDLKIAWKRCGSSIDFWVCDYLRDAPEDIMSSLAVTMYRKMMVDTDCQYPENVISYLDSDCFVKKNQEKYLNRQNGLIPYHNGFHKDLRESYERLMDADLVDEIPRLFLGWLPMREERSVGRSSKLMRAVFLQRGLDSTEVSDDLLDFCLYSQIASVSLEFAMEPEEKKREYLEKIASYPGHKTYEKILEKNDLSVREVSP